MLHLEISPILTDDLPIITCPSHVAFEMERSECPWSFQERKKKTASVYARAGQSINKSIKIRISKDSINL